MAQKYLGDFFDIHCGGEDHIPVHHTNEIAQTEARVGTRLANFWMHGYFLLSNDAKMAKSAGEFLRIQALIDRGYDPLAYRYLCLTAHYRSQLNFTWDALDAAATALERHAQRGLRARATPAASRTRATCERFTAEINDDLNMPRALALAWEVLRGDLPDRRPRKATLLAFDRVFGLGPRDLVAAGARRFPTTSARWPRRARRRARAKQWAEADRLRAELHAAGWEMEDAPTAIALKRRHGSAPNR